MVSARKINELIEHEIKNCKTNIVFYEEEIKKMREKIESLEEELFNC